MSSLVWLMPRNTYWLNRPTLPVKVCGLAGSSACAEKAGTASALARAAAIRVFCMGVSTGPALAQPAVDLAHGPDGARSADGQLMATYVHGLFDAPDACAALLDWAGLQQAQPLDLAALREASLDRLADCLEAEIDIDRMCGRA